MRLLLVEDSQRLRESLSLGLRRLGFTLDMAADGVEGLSLASSASYDVVILDLMLPRMDGLTVLRSLRARGNDVHVLILTARDAVADRVAGLRAGADDYLVKPFAFEELLARVQALGRRKYGVKSPVIRSGSLEVDLARRKVRVEGKTVLLPRREYALLECLALHRGRVVTRRTIEETLYDDVGVLESNAVDSAVCALRRLIDIPGRPSHIETHRGLGYSLRMEDNQPADE
ncbi:MAG: response regulator transcription factor [Candidatus Sumerlaeaceae bacterium]|nr:response regulator transcription factor [Candidatus Sumerlaeaceae bacterium]